MRKSLVGKQLLELREARPEVVRLRGPDKVVPEKLFEAGVDRPPPQTYLDRGISVSALKGRRRELRQIEMNQDSLAIEGEGV